MDKAPTFIASAAEAHILKPTDDTYQVLVLLRRDLGDDLALFEHKGAPMDGATLAKQVADELQEGYDAGGIAGHFQVLTVAPNLTPQVLNAITPATDLAPWQRQFAAAYGESDLDWMESLADTQYAGDTIFTAIMVELDRKEDCTDAEEAVKRLDSIIADLMKARDAITL